MRTNDPTEPERFQPLGSPIRGPVPAPPAPKPQGPAGFTQDADGRMRTTSHKPRP